MALLTTSSIALLVIITSSSLSPGWISSSWTWLSSQLRPLLCWSSSHPLHFRLVGSLLPGHGSPHNFVHCSAGHHHILFTFAWLDLFFLDMALLTTSSIALLVIITSSSLSPG